MSEQPSAPIVERLPRAILDLSDELLSEAEALHRSTDGWRLWLPGTAKKLERSGLLIEMAGRVTGLLDPTANGRSGADA